MPIADTDIYLRITGGASITDPELSLGGVMSTTLGGKITTDTDNLLVILYTQKSRLFL